MPFSRPYLPHTSSFAHSATSPSFAYVSNPVPDSSLCRAAAPDCVRFSCCSPIASASAAAPHAIASIRFNCCCSAELPACIRFSCCSPLASASAACCFQLPTASRLCLLRLLLPDGVRFNSAPRCRPLRLLLPDCDRFSCCSLIASSSAAAPRQLFWKLPPMSTILEPSTQSSRFSVN